MSWAKIDPIGRAFERKVQAAMLRAVNDTTTAAAISAKQNHGWSNRTGTLEGSYRFEPAEVVSTDHVRGRFGSFDVKYAIFLELGTRYIRADYTLRRAADAEFPKVGERLRRQLA